MSCKQIHVKTTGKQSRTNGINIMQIAMFRLTAALRSAGSNKLLMLYRMFSALHANLSRFFVLYVTCFDQNWRIIGLSGVYKYLENKSHSFM
jgi:hypothetical protein